MSEGKLKKRILKAGNWVQDGFIEGVPIHGDWWATNQKDTLLAVDEAKKKFPTVEQAVEEIKKSDKLLSKKERAVFSILEVRSMQLELAQNWFTEQFGDVE